jgi:CheY-like chemotaxis protein
MRRAFQDVLFYMSAAMSAGSTGPAHVKVKNTEIQGSAPEKPLVLIAEDHPDSRDALRALLEAYGYRVATAANGREAVDRAIATGPDLVLMDMMMPEMDGFEATRMLRQTEGFRQVPILALTAMDGAREMVLAAGCNEYLPKPIDVRTFMGRIRSWLESGYPSAH